MQREQVAPTPEAGVSKEEQFLKDIRGNISDLDEGSDANVVGSAKEICTLLDNGVSVDFIGEQYMEILSPEDAGYFVARSVSSFCPENTGKITG